MFALSLDGFKGQFNLVTLQNDHHIFQFKLKRIIIHSMGYFMLGECFYISIDNAVLKPGARYKQLTTLSMSLT